MIIITPNQMREVERLAHLEFGLSSEILIERAATAIYEVLAADYDNIKTLKIFFAVGPGNNGKDAVQLAKMLGMTVNRHPIESCDIVIDGLYGTGLNRPVSDADALLIEKINASGLPVYSVDIPSGVDGLTGNVHGAAIKAYKTITFFGCKPGMLFGDGKDCAGKVSIHDLGIPLSENIRAQITIGQAHLDPKILSRRNNTHKGTFGRVLCIAGSTGMRGAPSLCAMGAFAAGAGLVYVATTEKVWNTVSVLVPEAIGIILDENASGGISSNNLDKLLQAANNSDVIIVGPGMTTSEDTCKIVKCLINKCVTPLILDADALNSIEANEANEINMRGQAVRRDLLITPHLVEMERLSGVSKEEILSDRLKFVSNFSTSQRCVTLFKGAGTVISSPDGEVSINTNGNPGMAVAGSGDVLAGIIAGLAGQGLSLYSAACGGAFVHGMAGDLAANEKGLLSLTPRDIVKWCTEAFLSIERRTINE